MQGFKIEIDAAGQPMEKSLDGTNLKHFIREFLNSPDFLEAFIHDRDLTRYISCKNANRLFAGSLEEFSTILETHLDPTILTHPFVKNLNLLEAPQPVRAAVLRRGIQVGGVVPYIAASLVGGGILYLFKRFSAGAKYNPLSKDDRRWVITYKFGVFQTAQFVVKFSINPIFIQKYHWEYTIYSRLARVNKGTFKVENFYDWQQFIIGSTQEIDFVFKWEDNIYTHRETMDKLVAPRYLEHFDFTRGIQGGALIGRYNPNHKSMTHLDIAKMGLPAFAKAIELTLDNLHSAFYDGGLLHGDLKMDNVLISTPNNIRVDEVLLYDLDFSILVDLPVYNHLYTSIQPPSTNYLYTTTVIPRMHSVMFLHLFDIFFFAYSIHHLLPQELVNGLATHLQDKYDRSTDLDIFIECFNMISNFRNRYKAPAHLWDYLEFKYIVSCLKGYVYPSSQGYVTYPSRQRPMSHILHMLWDQEKIK
jgi:hypothetical protein